MTTKFNEVAMAASLAAFLNDAANANVAACVSGQDPLLRKVKIRPKTWTRWFTIEAPGMVAGTSSRLIGTVRLAERRALAQAVVDGMVILPTGHGLLARNDLHSLARELEAGATASRLIRLWVATMMWGSGTTNGRGPWRTRQSLEDPSLIDTLEASYHAVRGGELADAYRSFEIEGVGPSFFTKWFWVSSLTLPADKSMALILDKRVRASLWRLQPEKERVVPRGGQGYAMYVGASHGIAARLSRGAFPDLDAEKIEWLLFQRRGRSGEQRCLHDWLASNTS
jgi:8-oxoguanine DNA glycosylase-like protein